MADERRARATDRCVLRAAVSTHINHDACDGLMASAPSDGPALNNDDELERLRQLRAIVDLTAAVLMQGRLTAAEGEQLVAAARARILALFPDKEATYELILRPRFARLRAEFTLPAQVLPFRR